MGMFLGIRLILFEGLSTTCGDGAGNCTKQYDEDSKYCRKLKSPKARALCWAAIMAKYAVCLASK